MFLSPMKYPYIIFLVWTVWLFPVSETRSQSLNAGSPVFEEAIRRIQLVGNFDSTVSFHIRPLKVNFLSGKNVWEDYTFFMPREAAAPVQNKPDQAYTLLPVRNTFAVNTGRPYGWGNSLMIPNVGVQNYLTGGVSYRQGLFHAQLQPELVIAQNSSYSGYPDTFDNAINRQRFVYWNVGDSPERYADGVFARLGLGQSKVSLHVGSFELGASTENIWWGPGQFNALIFSNNAQGFPHISINTTRPAKTFLGAFEGQMVMGRLENSQRDPTQHPALNDRFFRDFSGDWRYLNAVSVSYQPKWVPGLFFGAARTFQSYNRFRGNSFSDWFPIFGALTKQKAGLDLVGESDRGRDQQISVYTRYLFIKAKSEIYFEYGRRDHAYNWREFFLNPEHGRAYLFGFNKLVSLPRPGAFLQFRGEMTQQQESINRLIRYLGGSGITWHTHGSARGFAHNGEALGVGAGTGNNVQTVEMAYVKGLNKVGVLLERVVNNPGFYYRAKLHEGERQHWVDLSAGVLVDYKWEHLMLSTKLQLINGKNYQWQLDPLSRPEIPKGMDKLSVFSQTHLIYVF